MSSEIKRMKDLADQGDSKIMYLYAMNFGLLMKRLNCENCSPNYSEASKYFHMAKLKGNIDAERQLTSLSNDPGSLVSSYSNKSIYDNYNENETICKESQNVQSGNDDFVSLTNNSYFDKSKLNIKSLLIKVRLKNLISFLHTVQNNAY